MAKMAKPNKGLTCVSNIKLSIAKYNCVSKLPRALPFAQNDPQHKIWRAISVISRKTEDSTVIWQESGLSFQKNSKTDN